MTAPRVLDRTDIDPSTSEPRCSHVVAGTKDMTGVELVMKARVNGTTVEALCGHLFVPSRDPRAYPVCEACKQIRDTLRPDLDVDGIPRS